MKKILKYILILPLTVTLVLFSCSDEERFPDFKTGVNARVALYPDNSYINFSDIDNSAVKFDIYSVNKDLDQIVYTASFLDADNPDMDFGSVDVLTVPASAFKNGKATALSVTAAQIADAFQLPGGTTYFSGGDKVTFKAKAKLKDGRIIDEHNSAPSITGGSNASFTTSFDIFVGCPSPVDVIEGTYLSTMEYNDAGEPTGKQIEVDVTFVGPEPFRYSVTDHTVELYVPYGGQQYPATFYDLCGVAILQPSTSFGDVVNLVTSNPNFLSPEIVINGDDVSFVLNWTETFNGISASVSFVKQN
jgi:hypothetical protein